MLALLWLHVFHMRSSFAIIPAKELKADLECFLPTALPALLAHSGAIEIPAMVMSILGGLLIYATIISFSMFFQEQEEF